MKNMISNSTKKLLGKEKICSFDVTKKDIRRFAQAINDSNPLYYDEEYAKKTKFKSIVAPPLFVQSFAFEDIPIHRLPSDGSPIELNIPIIAKKTVGGGSVYEIYQRTRPGDRITVKSKLVDIYIKSGRSGLLYFIVVDTIFTNQHGQIIAKEKATFIKRI
jgi:hypothetical protein